MHPPLRTHLYHFILIVVLFAVGVAGAYAELPGTDKAGPGTDKAAKVPVQQKVPIQQKIAKAPSAPSTRKAAKRIRLVWDGRSFSSKKGLRRYLVSKGVNWPRFVRLHPAAIAVLEGTRVLEQKCRSVKNCGGGPPPTTTTVTTTPTTTATPPGTTTTTTTTTTPAPSSGSSAYYGSSSPWNTAVASAGAVSQSSTWVSALYNAIPEIDVNRGAWTPSVFYADSSTPRRTWTLADGWVVDNVPTPTNLGISAEAETWTVIVDTARGLEYDFFDAVKSSSSPSGWSARNGGVGRLNGSGWWNNNLGPWIGHASGGENLGGLILKSDVDAGHINHALACSAPKNLIATTAVSPAMTSDGSGPSSAMPMGSRLQLDPSYSLSGMEAGEAMIARALQVYGCYVIDSSSGSLAFFAENYNFLPGGSNPYPATWGNGITKELVRHMRVVTPASAPAYDDRTVLGQPHK